MAETWNPVARRAKPTEILSHWPKLIENFNYSSQDFYDRVQQLLTERCIPNIRITAVDWPEGGILSPRREYLRITRQRLVFDICAAPFGKGFFVSIWFGRIPLRLGFLTWISLIIGLFGILGYVPQVFFQVHARIYDLLHIPFPHFLFIPFGCIIAAFLILIIRIGLEFDDFLIRSPVIGYFYEKYFRKITFYRIDLACMYQQAVHNAVTQVIDEITKPVGINPLTESDRKPTLARLY